jgi:hypothetical protein
MLDLAGTSGIRESPEPARRDPARWLRELLSGPMTASFWEQIWEQ